MTSQVVLPPFSECGGLIASTQYTYGITAVSSSGQEGAMASGVFSTAPLSAPLAPVVTLGKSATTWLNVSIQPACDTGGAVLPSYYYSVTHRDNVNGLTTTVRSSSQVACCSFVVDSLQVGQAYTVSVHTSNGAGASNQSEKVVQTTSGIPSVASLHLKRANTYSLALEIDKPEPMDYEIGSYDVVVSLDGNPVYSDTLNCQFQADQRQRECPRSFKAVSLSPLTTYSVGVRANGVLGSSEFSYRDFETSNELPGSFELLSLDSATVNGGVIMATVHRVGGTAGSSTIGVNITQPNNVVLRCDCPPSAGVAAIQAGPACSCGVYLANSRVASRPGTLTFQDGDESKTVSISVWEDDYSLVQPLTIVLGLVGPAASLAPHREMLLRIDQSQHVGFVAFARSKRQVLENATFVKLNVVRLNGSSGSLSLDVETFDVVDPTTATEVSPSQFYVPVLRTMTFVDKQSLGALWIRILDNSFYEGVRSFGVRLRTENMSLLSSSIVTKQVFILDDETPEKKLPGIPTDVQVTRTTGGQIEVHWQSPSTITDALLGGYLVQVTKSDQTSFFSLYNVSQPSFTLSSLPSRALYTVEVAAWNIFGLGAYTSSIQARTTEPTPPSVPTALRLDAMSSSTFTLTWESSQDCGGTAITGYVLNITGAAILAARTYDVVFAGGTGAATLTVEDLDADTTYSVAVAAVSSTFHPVGSSDTPTAYATISVTTTSGMIPGQPPVVTLLKSPAAGTLSLQIHAPRDLGGLPLTDYSLYLRRVVDPLQPSQNVESFRVVCTSASPMVNNISLTCMAYRLLTGTTYEVYATVDNTVVRPNLPLSILRGPMLSH